MKTKIPKSAITEKQLKKLLKQAGKETGSRRQWAQDNEITSQAVSAFLTGSQNAGLQIPQALGYRPQTVYLPLDEKPISTAVPSRVKK